MKKNIKKYVSVFAIAAAAAGILFAAETNAVIASEVKNVQVSEERSYDTDRLDIPAEAECLIVVEAEGLTANVSTYEKEKTENKAEGPGVPANMDVKWKLEVSTDAGLIGRGGMGKIREGDEKTPAGLYKMNTPFGTASAQEGFPENYLQVDGRYYWDGDSASVRYNKLVNTDEYTAFDRSKSEHLSSYGGAAYHYCIDTGYNFEGMPNKGSALFLHCSAGKNTAGCIAIPERSMTEIMKLYREGKTYILLDEKGNFEQYYKTEKETDPAEENSLR